MTIGDCKRGPHTDAAQNASAALVLTVLEFLKGIILSNGYMDTRIAPAHRGRRRARRSWGRRGGCVRYSVHEVVRNFRVGPNAVTLYIVLTVSISAKPIAIVLSTTTDAYNRSNLRILM